MSGNNGGDGGNSGGGSASSPADCQKVSVKTSIISPDPAVLATLREGDILNIKLRSVTGPLIAITSAGSILGSVFTTDPAFLINCINQGNEYEAKILKISGADCQISIRPE